ncbi:MAG: DNA-processing protein DprA [Sporolactobacillus sp.]
MDKKTVKLVQLTHCRGIGRRLIHRLLRSDPELRQLDHLSRNELIEEFGFSKRNAEYYLEDYSSLDGERLVSDYSQKGIQIIALHHKNYPRLLREIYDPPFLLYACGNTDLLQSERSLAVVGSRHPEAEAWPVMEKLLMPLIESGWTLVSGMANGVDGMVHKLSLEHRTIAVLGSGLFHPYPSQNRNLFQQLCRYQLVLSEYPPDARPERWRFPERNRIISGLSLGTLVIEARERSGSLITADQAIEQGREVFAVPGSVLNPNSSGTHGLIQQGAKLVMKSSDITDELQLAAK